MMDIPKMSVGSLKGRVDRQAWTEVISLVFFTLSCSSQFCALQAGGLFSLELTASGSARLYTSAKQMTAAYDVMSLLMY